MRRHNLAFLAVILAPAIFFAAQARMQRPAAAAEIPPARPINTELADRDVQIAVWKKALAADSESAIALGQLAGLYMQRGRESGDESNYATAAEYAQRSVNLRSNRNGAAFVTLASALLAQHRFVEARVVARELVANEPDIPQYRAMLGEVELELGDYDAARVNFDSLYALRTHLSIAPRLARWLEINGQSDAARKLLNASLMEAKGRKDLPREQIAWFHLRVGDIEMRNGRMRGARSAFEDGLKVDPDDYRLLSAMARLEAVEGHPRKTIEFGERAMSIKLDPATLGTISDAYSAVGDTATAAEYLKTMEVAVAGQPGAYHRAWSLFLLDHDLRVDEVLGNVKGELETRRDVYGYDLLAWALHKAGNNVDARRAMAKAMRMNTQDAMLYYHAGVIDDALGDDVHARENLKRALEIDPFFHPAQPADARRILASMKA
ncbi:MAG: tetratricopeptide repeat protein [Gemmatimonadaceae bacterium]